MFINSRKRGSKATPDYFGAKKGFGLKAKFDPHLIQPGVSWDEEALLKKIPQFIHEQTGSECTLPQHCIDDVYSMYVNDHVKRKERNKKNNLKHNMLDKTYNSLTKVVTKDSPLFSQILTRELALYMQELQDQLEEEMEKEQPGSGENPFDQDDGEPSPGEGDGQGNGQGDEGDDGENEGDEQPEGGKAPTKDKGSSSRTPEEMMDDIMNQQKNEKKLDDAIDKAEKKMQDLKDQLGEEALKELSTGDPEFLDKAERLKNELKKLDINKENLRNTLQKILSKSSTYFSKKYTVVEESIFEAEELTDVVGLEYLHPAFKYTHLGDIVNRTKKYEGKIDLYLDCSGSMSSYENMGGRNMSLADMTKGIAIVLYRMGLLDKLYFFDGQVYEIPNPNELTILSFSRSGGTNFNNVINQVKINDRNSIIVTDGEDSVNEYIKNVFWVGVGGTRFGGGYYNSGQAFNTYRENKQCVTFNPNNQLFEQVV